MNKVLLWHIKQIIQWTSAQYKLTLESLCDWSSAWTKNIAQLSEDKGLCVPQGLGQNTISPSFLQYLMSPMIFSNERKKTAYTVYWNLKTRLWNGDTVIPGMNINRQSQHGWKQASTDCASVEPCWEFLPEAEWRHKSSCIRAGPITICLVSSIHSMKVRSCSHKRLR